MNLFLCIYFQYFHVYGEQSKFKWNEFKYKWSAGNYSNCKSLNSKSIDIYEPLNASNKFASLNSVYKLKLTFCKFKLGKVSGGSFGSSMTSKLLHHSIFINEMSCKFVLLGLDVP